jgi:hypothetical protein
MECISLTKLVLKLDQKLIDFKLLHPANIEDILVTLLVLKADKSIVSKAPCTELLELPKFLNISEESEFIYIVVASV